MKLFIFQEFFLQKYTDGDFPICFILFLNGNMKLLFTDFIYSSILDTTKYYLFWH